MKYEIIGTTFPAVKCTFENANESMYTQSGAMAWMTDNIKMDSNMKGGLGRSIGRMFSGESLFMATYTAGAPNTHITFASTVPGEVVALDIGETGGLICQKDAFLCAQPSVELKVAFTKKLSAGLFGGEGFILQDISGSGMVFLELDGNKMEYTLEAGEVLKVDTGNVVAFEKSVKYEIETVKGIKNIFFGGEGLFLTRLTGPGKVILQTRNFNELVGKIASKLPSDK